MKTTALSLLLAAGVLAVAGDAAAGLFTVSTPTIPIATGETCGTKTCSLNETCGWVPANTIPPSMVKGCVCKSGLERVGSSCVDINECLSNPCHTNATCRNTFGGYACDLVVCGSQGYCADDAHCVTGGSGYLSYAFCSCNPGYHGNGITCTDNDECAAGACGAHRTCYNTAGSYSCGGCQAGYVDHGGKCECPEDQGAYGSGCRACTALEISGDGVCNPLPNHYDFVGTDPDDSDLGPVDSNQTQGIAHSDTHWFWTNYTMISRVPRSGGWVELDLATAVPPQFAALGYDHFGDPDFYAGRLYVPVTKQDGPITPVVLVFDEDLNFISWAQLTHGGGAWVAVNPKDGRLYSSDPYRKLLVYDLAGLISAAYSPTSYAPQLGFVGASDLNFVTGPDPSDGWWNDAWSQGGAFSRHGVFYYTLDHRSDDYSDFTGVHAFKVPPTNAFGTTSAGITLPASTEIRVNNGGYDFMHISYNDEDCYLTFDPWPTEKCARQEELEGLTVTDDGGQGQIHQILLDNDPLSADEVTIFHFRVNNTF